MADVTKVVAGRNVILYSEPWLAANVLPLDTVSWGTTWGGTWVDMGYTQEGIEFELSVDRSEIYVDQEMDAILRPITGRGVVLRSTLAEFTPAHVQLGIGQGAVTSVAAGTGTRGHDDFDLTSTVADQFNSWGFDVLNPGDNEAIRVIGYRCLATGGMTTGFGKADDNAKIPIEVSALPDSSTTPSRILKIRDISAALP